jgi:hypothetical protein
MDHMIAILAGQIVDVVGEIARQDGCSPDVVF